MLAFVLLIAGLSLCEGRIYLYGKDRLAHELDLHLSVVPPVLVGPLGSRTSRSVQAIHNIPTIYSFAINHPGSRKKRGSSFPITGDTPLNGLMNVVTFNNQNRVGQPRCQPQRCLSKITWKKDKGLRTKGYFRDFCKRALPPQWLLHPKNLPPRKGRYRASPQNLLNRGQYKAAAKRKVVFLNNCQQTILAQRLRQQFGIGSGPSISNLGAFSSSGGFGFGK